MLTAHIGEQAGEPGPCVTAADESPDCLRSVTDPSQTHVAAVAEPSAMCLQRREAKLFKIVVMVPCELGGLSAKIAVTGDERGRQIDELDAVVIPARAHAALAAALPNVPFADVPMLARDARPELFEPGPIDPSPTIDQAINGGFPWLEIKCSRCQTPRDVDLCALPHVPTTCVHDLAGRLVCQKCKKAGKRPAATLLQLAPRSRQPPPEN